VRPLRDILDLDTWHSAIMALLAPKRNLHAVMSGRCGHRRSPLAPLGHLAETSGGSRLRCHQPPPDRWQIKIKVSGKVSGKWRLREPIRGLRLLVCARVLAGQAFYLGLQNLPVIHGKEKVYGSIPYGGSRRSSRFGEAYFHVWV
jgi:hypothetical protein